MRIYVFCGGMYRACSTWQYEIASRLIEERLGGRRIGYLTGRELAELDDRRDRRAETERQRSDQPWPPPNAEWLVVKSHEESPRIARILSENRGLAIYAYRDLRDVVFSMMHKRGVAFETFVAQGMIHQILANDRFWMSRPRVLVQRYDDLIGDPASAARRLAGHLGLTLSVDESESLAREFSREANQERAKAFRNRLIADGVNLDDPANQQLSDPETLLHWNHVREGQPKTWRELATPAQQRILAKLCGRWLMDRGYETDRAWAPDSKRWRFDAAEQMLFSQARWHGSLQRLSLRFPNASARLKTWLGAKNEP